ncbi:hypothetical protein ACC671_10985 [Rhizobium ruizarguesonis]
MSFTISMKSKIARSLLRSSGEFCSPKKVAPGHVALTFRNDLRLDVTAVLIPPSAGVASSSPSVPQAIQCTGDAVFGYVTEDAYRLFYGQSVENIVAGLGGKPTGRTVMPEGRRSRIGIGCGVRGTARQKDAGGVRLPITGDSTVRLIHLFRGRAIRRYREGNPASKEKPLALHGHGLA